MPRRGRSARTDEILALVDQGDLSLQEIGDRYGITRQAVHQLCVRYGHQNMHFHKRQENIARKREEERAARDQVAWDSLDVPMTPIGPNAVPWYSDEELLTFIRDFVEEHGYLPHAHEPGFPASNPVYIKRFGTWNAAIDAAGYVVEHPRSPYRRTFTDEVIVTAVRAFVDHVEATARANGTRPSAGCAKYSRWREENPEMALPSLALIRQRMGWREARLRAAEARKKAE